MEIEWIIDHFIEHKKIKIFDFLEMEPMSTYLYTINAGPWAVYHHITDKESPPQRVFFRSTNKRLDPRNITVLVEKTISFYEQVFGIKFPFRKLDHVLCPDVRYAAMESAGCITYSE